MRNRISDHRMVWLAAGLLAGLGLSYFWPHEPALAETDRGEKFAMVTAKTGLGGSDAIFVLDFLTGRLQGAALNAQSGKFTQLYVRHVAADFNLDPSITPQYAILSGHGGLPGRQNATPASDVIYVGELTSGKVMCYAFPFRVTQRPMPANPLVPVTGFPFRESAPSD